MKCEYIFTLRLLYENWQDNCNVGKYGEVDFSGVTSTKG